MKSLLYILFISVSMSVWAQEKNTLKVVNWIWYIPVDESLPKSLPVSKRSPVLQEFEKQFNCKIDYVELNTEEQIYSFVTTKASDVDVFNLPTSYMLKLKDQGRLSKLSQVQAAQLNNWNSIEQRAPYNQLGNYGFPYSGGTTVIMYRKQWARENNITAVNAGHVFKPVKGTRIALLNSSDSLVMALNYLDTPEHTADKKDLKKAVNLIRILQDNNYLKSISSNLEDTAAKMVDGELDIAFMYHSDANQFLREYPNELAIEIVPKNPDFYVDFWGVLEQSKNKKLAIEFLNFLGNKERQLNIAEELGSIPMGKFSEQELKEHDILFPHEALRNARTYSLEHFELCGKIWRLLLKELKTKEKPDNETP